MYVYKVGFAQQSAEYMIAIDIIFTRAVINKFDLLMKVVILKLSSEELVLILFVRACIPGVHIVQLTQQYFWTAKYF